MNDYQLQAEQEIWDEIAQNAPRRRYATVRADSRRQLEAYLPENYRIDHVVTLPDERINAVISGEDFAGWTLDDYVIPRLASGGLFATERDNYAEAVEIAVAPIN